MDDYEHIDIIAEALYRNSQVFMTNILTSFGTET